MAWIEILKMNYPDDELIPELDKDIRSSPADCRQILQDRFLPEPVPLSLNEVMDHVIDYMDRRTSKKVKMMKVFPDHDIHRQDECLLFEWVIENLSKNAVMRWVLMAV